MDARFFLGRAVRHEHADGRQCRGDGRPGERGVGGGRAGLGNVSTVATAAEEMGGVIKEIAKNAHEAAGRGHRGRERRGTTNATVAKLGDSRPRSAT